MGLLESLINAVGTKTRHCAAGIPIELELEADLRALKFKRPPTTTHLKFKGDTTYYRFTFSSKLQLYVYNFSQ